MANNASPLEWIFAIIVGLLIVLSVPVLKELFVGILGAILSVILIGVFIGVFILVVWLILDHYS